jgi:branched-subunit amino acid transport protein
MSDLALAGVIVAAGLGTYFWRAMGVVLSGRIRTDGALFQWVGCVAYAMIAGLAVRILVLPTGTLTVAPMPDRIGACALAFLVYIVSRRNLFLGVGTGFAAITLLQLLRA